MPTLTLRPTIIAGDRLDHDYLVIWNGIPVGRILKQPGVPPGRPNWSWGVIFPHLPQQSFQRGIESDLAEAKRRFKVAWRAIERELTEEDIRKAREEEEKLATRPWNRHGRGG